MVLLGSSLGTHEVPAPQHLGSHDTGQKPGTKLNWRPDSGAGLTGAGADGERTQTQRFPRCLGPFPDSLEIQPLGESSVPKSG